MSIMDLGVRTPKLTVLDHFWGPNPVGPDWPGRRNPFVRSSDPPDGPFGGVKTPPKYDPKWVILGGPGTRFERESFKIWGSGPPN